MRGLSICCLVALACFPTFGLAAETAPTHKLQPGACPPDLPPEAKCGLYEVWENRAAKSGRKIPLQVAVLPATGPERLPDPIVYFGGGPGVSSIYEGADVVGTMPDARKNRDVLLIDGRGTGKSGALSCAELRGTTSIQGFLENFMPADKVRACRDRLQKSADLTQYSNDNVVDDAEEIRVALGYGKANLMGISYGTRPVQVYLRRHPGSVRTAAMIGAIPLDEPFPLVAARYAQQGLDGMLAECEGDAACRKAFPKLREETAAVFRQLERQPVKVQAVSAETGQPIDFTLSKNGLGQVLRRMLYYNNWIRLTPVFLHKAANGDWQPFAEFAQIIAGVQGTTDEGYYLAITCAEDVAILREEEIPAAVAGTFLGDLRARKQQEACASWPAPKLGPDFHVPVVSDIPTLLLSGSADPATPPSSGEKVARGLKRSRHVVIEDGGHGLGGMKGEECVPRMTTEVIVEGTVESLDTSCVARMRRPDFLLSIDPEVKLKPEELQRLTGTWAAKDGMEIETEAVGGYLRVVFPDGPLLLAATSPTRFRLRSGEPDFVLTFGLQEGRAVTMDMEEQDGTQTWTRKERAARGAR